MNLQRIIILATLLFSHSLYAQEHTQASAAKSGKFNPLAIKDELPDFKITKIINSTVGELNTADFKDRLLIIDFWATYCHPCLEELPLMDSLQQQFGNKIKILPVTYEREAEIVKFWAENKHTKGLKLCSVVEDQAFDAWFPHAFIPFKVWIYKGKVISMTRSADAETINKVLSGKEI